MALVVGNSAYERTSPLANPVNDAEAVGAALTRIGFDVTVKMDADEDKMGDALGEFEEVSADVDVALLFYAGHGMEMNGANYLIPVDARLASAAAVPRETIPLDSVLASMANARTRIVILDACRNNPFARGWGPTRAGRSTGGLAPVAASGGGLLVAYAAAPGEVADDGDAGGNSPYTTALLEHLERPGVDVRVMLGDVGAAVMADTGGQQPFVSYSMSGEHHLNPLPSGSADPPTVAAGGSPDSALVEQETAYWRSVENSANPEDLEEYLKRWPDGAFVRPARTRLAALRPDPPRFRNCDGCPEMVVIPAGAFRMGSPASASEEGRHDDEGPQHRVEGPQHRVELRSFALGVTEVTFDEWDACVRGGGCDGYRPDDEGWGRGARPVINVSWEDAQAYVSWLSGSTGAAYRLPSESEWEYAARAGTETPFHTGATISTDQANYSGRTTPVGTFAPNAFGLHDVHGSVWEWVEDCWHDSYRGAPRDGAAWTSSGDCGRRVLRGGSWNAYPGNLRSAARYMHPTEHRNYHVGFRVARTLD